MYEKNPELMEIEEITSNETSLVVRGTLRGYNYDDLRNVEQKMSLVSNVSGLEIVSSEIWV